MTITAYELAGTPATRMSPAIRSAWAAALRSGNYIQGTRRLRSGDTSCAWRDGRPQWIRENDTWCCLGVLCDLHAQATGGSWDRKAVGPQGDTQERDLYLGCMAGLPRAVAAWAGLATTDPRVVTEDGRTLGLSTLNDGYKGDEAVAVVEQHGFEDIAELVEGQL